MWVPVKDEPPREMVAGIAGGRRVRTKPPDAKLTAPDGGDLPDWEWQETALSTEFAAKLGFSVAQLSATASSRVLIAEFTRSAVIEGTGVRAKYGVCARLVVGVSETSLKGSLTLPAIAAESQLSASQRSVQVFVRGYVGEKLKSMLPTEPITLDVKGYRSLMTNFNGITDLISSDTANMRPKELWIEAVDEGPAKIDHELTRAIAMAWAMHQIEQRKPLERALDDYTDRDDEVARRAISDAYADLLPGGNRDRAGEAAAHAKRLLDGLKVEETFLHRISGG